MRFIVLSLCLLAFFSCKNEQVASTELAKYVPNDAALVFSIKNLDVFKSNLANNKLIGANPDFHLVQSTKEALKRLNYINTSNQVLVAFSETDDTVLDYTLITKDKDNLFLTDSITDTSFETITYAETTIHKVTLDETTSFSTILDSVFLASNSQLVIENAIRNQGIDNTSNNFNTLLETSGEGTSIILNASRFDKVFNNYFETANSIPIQKFSGYFSVDLEMGQQSILLNGIAAQKDTIPKILDVFKGQQPQESSIAQITPLTADGFFSFTYNDFSLLRENLKTYHSSKRELKPIENDMLFNSAKELGVIYNESGNVTFLNSIDAESTKQALISEQDIEDTYRDVSIYKFSDTEIFSEALNPLLTLKEANYYTVINSFFLFAETPKALKDCIANWQTKSVFGVQDFYQDIVKSLSDEGSILLVGNLERLKETLAPKVDEDFEKDWQEIKLAEHKLAALQFIKEGDYAHVHGILEQVGSKATSKGITQTASIVLDTKLRGNPQLFNNHTNGTKDILAQDVNNVLYLISNKGKLRWKKELDSDILGDITQVDIYKNNKYQMAFVTQDKLYVLDRNGDNVENFPISFNDPVTQPLATFDYDTNKRYRFLVTQGETVLMYNKEAERVTGFKFNEADDTIINTPKHIRIGSKDYILVMTDSGKLHILSRTGKERIPIDTNLDLSDNDWYKYKNAFASTNENGELMRISQDGKLSIEKLGLPQDHYITATNKTLVTMHENILSIKGKDIELDFGLYSRPRIFYINNKIYVAVTDTQAHKVYLFDSNGFLRPGFPVYANSIIDMENMDNDDALEFIVKGEDDSVLIYKIN